MARGGSEQAAERSARERLLVPAGNDEQDPPNEDFRISSYGRVSASLLNRAIAFPVPSTWSGILTNGAFRNTDPTNTSGSIGGHGPSLGSTGKEYSMHLESWFMGWGRLNDYALEGER